MAHGDGSWLSRAIYEFSVEHVVRCFAEMRPALTSLPAQRWLFLLMRSRPQQCRRFGDDCFVPFCDILVLWLKWGLPSAGPAAAMSSNTQMEHALAAVSMKEHSKYINLTACEDHKYFQSLLCFAQLNIIWHKVFQKPRKVTCLDRQIKEGQDPEFPWICMRRTKAEVYPAEFLLIKMVQPGGERLIFFRCSALIMEIDLYCLQGLGLFSCS